MAGLDSTVKTYLKGGSKLLIIVPPEVKCPKLCCLDWNAVLGTKTQSPEKAKLRDEDEWKLKVASALSSRIGKYIQL